MFAQAGVEYEDVRVPKEKWGQLKPSERARVQQLQEEEGRKRAAVHVMCALFRTADTPWGTMPFLEVDGKRIGGSPVIARFLAERFGGCCRHAPSSDALGCYARLLSSPRIGWL